MVEIFQIHPGMEHLVSQDLERFRGFEKKIECFVPLNKGVPYKRKFSKFYKFLDLFTTPIWALWTKICSYRGRKQTWNFVNKRAKIMFFCKKNTVFAILGGVKNEFYQKKIKMFSAPTWVFRLIFLKKHTKKTSNPPLFFTKKCDFLLYYGQKRKYLAICKKSRFFFRFPPLNERGSLLINTL